MRSSAPSKYADKVARCGDARRASHAHAVDRPRLGEEGRTLDCWLLATRPSGLTVTPTLLARANAVSDRAVFVDRDIRYLSAFGGKADMAADTAASACDPMYGPAVRCKKALRVGDVRSCINVSGLCLGAFCAPGHHGYQRACDLISGQASMGPFGSPVFACAGKTDPPLFAQFQELIG